MIVPEGGGLSKFTVVVSVLAGRGRVQVLAPEQPPFQLSKMAPVAGVAVRVTLVPPSKEAEQEGPQLIPRGVEATVPLPVPSRTTERMELVPGGPLTTVSAVLPLRSPEVAMIVADPGLRPVARPFASIVATFVSLLVHVTPPKPVTATGVNASVIVPLPSRPKFPAPQHCREPS